jgi:hypothetical protein
MQIVRRRLIARALLVATSLYVPLIARGQPNTQTRRADAVSGPTPQMGADNAPITILVFSDFESFPCVSSLVTTGPH